MKYLFWLAHLCSTPPPMVDKLRYLDFVNLIMWIDAYNDARK